MNFNIANNARLLIILTLAGAALAGCAAPTAAPTAVPTIDPATFVAAAVGTISAQMTADAVNHPSATPMPTATPLPTATPVPPTATPIPVTLTPSMTFTPVAPPLSAKASFPVTFPVNKREYLPNEKFSVEFGFKNIGTITWDTGYTLKLVSFTGEASVQIENITLSHPVKPGETAIFDLWAYGSEIITTHVWSFQMYSSSGAPVSGAYSTFSYTSITN